MQQQTCYHHPERSGHAVCMGCHRVLCQECSTTWDGIHHCSDCLARRRQAQRGRGSFWGWAGMLLASLACFYLTARLMVWTTVLISGLLESP